MKDKVQIHRYTINFESSPNALTTESSIAGALIKYKGGHGCLQPWPSLGDDDLNFHLLSIIENRPTEQALACLKCCEIDSNARDMGIDLFRNLSIPKSHLTVPFSCDHNISTDIYEQSIGHSHIKVKGGNDIETLVNYLEKLPQHLSIRVDFNSSLEPNQLVKFTQNLSHDCLQRIDFIEDPFPYDPEAWKRFSELTRVNFALDRGPFDASIGFAVRIWKPSIFPAEPINAPVCITHNMDHELGRRYAAYQAGIIKSELTVHGTGNFESSKNGTGFGMDDYLESIVWGDLT